MMSPKRLWFKSTTTVVTALTGYFLGGGPQWTRLNEAEAAQASRFAQQARALKLDAHAQKQVTDFEGWKQEEAAATAVRRAAALKKMRDFSGAAAQEVKAKAAKKLADDIKKARPTAAAERALAKAKVMKLSPAQTQVELAMADGPVAAKLKTRRPPAVLPETKPRLSPEWMSPVEMPHLKPRTSGPQHGAQTPELKSFYAEVSGQSAEVLQEDGSLVTVEETLAQLTLPPRSRQHASLESDVGRLMLPLSALPGPAADDLLETAETRRSPELLALVQQLGRRPLDLYNFVHTKVVPQLYYGSKKGSAQTLAELAGNDFDQAALLVALLRAAGTPARYEYGTVELSVAQALALTGAKDLASAAVMLSRTGPAVLAPDGKTIQAERAWVRAFVPYADWRGTGPGGEKLWVRLDPGMKETKYTPAVSLKGLAHFDFAAFMAQPTTKTPADIFEAQLLAAAKAKSLCSTLDDALSKVVVTQKAFELLPAEHPSRVLASLLVFSRPPANFRHLVDVSLDGAAVAQLELAELEGRALSLTYPGSSPADVAAIAAAGGIANVSPQFVSVTPTLALDGVAHGTFAPTNPGTAQLLSLRVAVPGGNPVLGVHHLVAGTGYAVLVEGGELSALQLAARSQAIVGTTGDAQSLARAQAAVGTYARQAEEAYTRLFSLQGHAAIKDVFLGVAGKQLRVSYFLGLPVGLAPGSFVIDISRDALSPLPKDGDDSLRAELVRWAGWQGSTTEGRAWEAVLGGLGMSSVKTLQVATSQGVPVFILTPASHANRSQLSGYGADTLADVDTALAAGWSATIPLHPVSIGHFQNIEGYVLENPVDGEGAFRLGSSLNGGEGDPQPAPGPSENTPPPGCPYCGNSVTDLATGNWRETYVDLTLPAIGLPIVFSRTYASRSTNLTPMGYGWVHSYGMFLRAEANGDFSYVREDSREVRFAHVGAGYQSAPGWHLSLIDVAGGGHSMRSKDGMVWDFDAAGALTRISEPSGNAISLGYSGGQLTQVLDSSSQVALTLSYSGNKLTSVLDRSGRTVRFGFTNDDLTAATDALNHTETYAYNGEHNLVQHADKRGKTFVEFYDLQDRWVGFRDPAGAEMSVAYDAVNQQTAYTDKTGSTFVTQYDANAEPLAQVDPLGNKGETTWDADLNPLSRKDARGFTTSMTWDALGNELTRTDPDLRVTTNVYEPTFSRLRSTSSTGLPSVSSTFDGDGRLLTRTDGLGVTTYGYDGRGQLLTVTSPGSAVTTFGRDVNGNVTSMLDPTNRATAIGFDAAGHVTSVTDGNNHTRTMEVDAAGRVTAMLDALNARSEFTYDDEGHRLTSKDAANGLAHFDYDALGRLTKSTDALGNFSTTEYDAEGRVVATVDANHNRTEMTYDAAGRLVETRSADGAVTTQSFCADVGSACAMVDALGHLSTTAFDSVGRVTSQTDALGRVTSTRFDSGGRAQFVSGPNQPPMTYFYNQAGLLSDTVNGGTNLQTSLTYDARGNRTGVSTNTNGGPFTRYTFDAANRLLTETNPLHVVTTYSYDAAGSRSTKLDGNGQLTTYEYDENRRLTTVTCSDATKYEFAYDSRGNRTLEKGPSHERHLAYDARNRVATTTDVTFGKSLSFTYDGNGNRASVNEGGTSFGYFYDSVNRLKRADGFGGSIFFDYDAAGRRTSELRPNGIRTAWAYDDGNQLLSMTHSKAGSVVLGFSYEYDGHGMRVSKGHEDGSKEVYGYDPGDRLTQVDYGTTKRVAYSLDALGNRALEDTTSPGQPLIRNSTVFNVFNQLVTSDSIAGVHTAFAYDGVGNTLSETRTPSGFPAEVTTYGWDKDNRLRSLTPPTGTPTTYSYDSNGLRVERVDSTGTTRYLLDGSSVLEELDGTNATTIKYLNNPQQIDEVLAYQRGSQTEYPLTDALGSLYAATDASGNVVHRYDFDVYGARSDLGGIAAAIDRGYTSREHDKNGLINNGRRQRNPLLGGWTQPDRAGMIDGPNLYNYVMNMPTMATDPTGEMAVDYSSLDIAGAHCTASLSAGDWALAFKFREAQNFAWMSASGLVDWAETYLPENAQPVVVFEGPGLIDGNKYAATEVPTPVSVTMGHVGRIRISIDVVVGHDIDFIAHTIVHEVAHYARWKPREGKELSMQEMTALWNSESERAYWNINGGTSVTAEGYQAEMKVFGSTRIHN